MIRLLVLIFSLLTLSPSFAAEKTEKSPTISPWLYKKIQQAERLIAKKSYSQAEQKFKSMLQKSKTKSYEQAIILRSLSSVYALSNQYKKATVTLAKAIALNVLPKKQEQQAIVNLGQLYMAIEQYAKAIQILEPWLAKNSTSNAQINVLVANAYAQLKKYRKALPYIQKAIAKTKKPAESWYQLNLALYYELGNYNSAAKILKKLISAYPEKKQYWGQLASTYQQLKQYKKAAAVNLLSYKKGFIRTEKDLLALVNLLLYVNSPYKGATLLDQLIQSKKVKSSSKNWEIVAHAWGMAKEHKRTIKALEIASSLNDKGSLYQQLGQIYVKQERWPQAIKSFNKALSKGSLKDTGATYLLLGMSYYEMNNTKQAKKQFLKASRYSKNKKAAKQWLEYISDANKSL